MVRNNDFSDEFDDIDFGTRGDPEQTRDAAPPSQEPVDEGDEPPRVVDGSVAGDGGDDGGGYENETPPPGEPAEVEFFAGEDRATKPEIQIDLPDAAEFAKKVRLKEHREEQLRRAIWVHPEDSRANMRLAVEDALASFEAIDPRDEFERMLAQQMIACHNAAMECLRRAAISTQGFVAWDKQLAHAEKLIATFVKLQDALNKHRGKGQQKVTVEHVHVHSGGQAVVGHVEAGSHSTAKTRQGAIEHGSEVPLAPQEPKAYANLRKKE